MSISKFDNESRLQFPRHIASIDGRKRSGLKWGENRAGLTLLELLIVLVILAALTAVAVRSLAPAADQARYERSQRLLQEVEQAYQLRSIESGGAVSYSGFIADMGRLPIATSADPETQLSELWDATGQPVFTISNFNDPDTTVNDAIPVAAGWKGPYLLLSPGRSSLRDGFGNAHTVLDTMGNPAGLGDSIAGIVSLGSNGVANPLDVDYERDLSLPGGLWTAARFSGTVPIQVFDSAGLDPVLGVGESLKVRLYGPVNGVAGRIDNQILTAGGSGEYAGVVNATCGPRVIIAMVTTGVAPNETIVRQSIPYQIIVSPGMNPTKELVLP